jgi:hypothetical protein
MPKKNSQLAHNQSNSLGKFADVPQEILLYILSFLNPSELCLFSRLSKPLNAAASSDALWKMHLVPIFGSSDVNQIIEDNEIDLTKKEQLYPAKALFKHFSALSIFGQKTRLVTLLSKMEEVETELGFRHGRHPLSLQYQEQIEKAGKLKRKKFGFIRFGEPEVNMEKLGSTIKSVKALHFDKIKEIADFVRQRKSATSDFSQPSGLLALYAAITRLIDTYGDKAAVVMYPECLQKILNYIKSVPSASDNYLHVLAEVLVHEKIAQHPALPRLLDTLISYMNDTRNRMFLTKLIMSGEKTGDTMVEILLSELHPRSRMPMSS